MTSEEYRKVVFDVAYLAACSINGETPEADRVSGMDLDILYKVTEKHSVTGIVAYALESCGVKDPRFTQSLGKTIRKVAAFDIECAKVSDELEKAGIWHVPLRGMVLKDMYPKIGMRQMSDVDILFDVNRIGDCKTIMEGLGFTLKGMSGVSVNDVYRKLPIFNFEMHIMLYSKSFNEAIFKYYQDVRSRLICDEGKKYRCHFSLEDFYVCVTSHTYKHYSGSGTGLRYLFDTYVFMKKYSDSVDMEYIKTELGKMGIAEFEEKFRELAFDLLEGNEFSDEENEMFEYVITSGTYGNIANRVENKLNAQEGRFGFLKYVWNRLFLPWDNVKSYYPTYAKYPFLLPVLFVYRIVRAVFKRRKKLKTELKAIVKHYSNKG